MGLYVLDYYMHSSELVKQFRAQFGFFKVGERLFHLLPS